MLDFCLNEALATAEHLDEYYEYTGQPIGPLHGIPVTFKDQFHVCGTETTLGYTHWIGTFEGKEGTGKDKVTDSLMVQQVRKLGAVPIGLVCHILISSHASH